MLLARRARKESQDKLTRQCEIYMHVDTKIIASIFRLLIISREHQWVSYSRTDQPLRASTSGERAAMTCNSCHNPQGNLCSNGNDSGSPMRPAITNLWCSPLQTSNFAVCAHESNITWLYPYKPQKATPDDSGISETAAARRTCLVYPHNCNGDGFTHASVHSESVSTAELWVTEEPEFTRSREQRDVCCLTRTSPRYRTSETAGREYSFEQGPVAPRRQDHN